MKPAPFEYRAVGSIDEACAVLAQEGDAASILAGGQSLVPLLNLRLARPSVIVDITRVPELAATQVGRDVVRLGATARARQVERDPDVRRALPVLAQAIGHIGHPQIRSRTTIGGNVAHADPASELPALLLALDGAVELTSEAGTRRVAAADFFQHVFTTDRRPHELVTAIEFPVPEGFRFAMGEVARRRGDYAMVGAVVGVRSGDQGIDDARVALFGVSTRPVRVPEAEQAARDTAGKRDGASNRAAAEDGACIGAAVRSAIEPVTDLHASADYRRSVAGTLVQRLVASLLEAA